MDRDSVLAFSHRGDGTKETQMEMILPLMCQEWAIFLDRMTLTEREKLLIELLQNQAETYARSPWQSYFENDGIRPTTF